MSMPEYYIDALNELSPHEIEQLLSNLPDSINFLISSVKMKLSQDNDFDNERYLDIIRLVLCVAARIGGAAIYMPYPRDSKIMQSFTDQLTTFVLQDAPITLEAIEASLERPTIQHKCHWPTFLQMTLEALQCELRGMNITLSQKENVVRRFIESFLLNFSGRARSFPMAAGRLSLLKRKAIYKAFTGDNVNELVVRFGMTASVIYSYIRQERASRKVNL